MVNYKGKDRIEFGYKPYAEASYGSSPGAVATTLYKIGYCRSIEPAYDPEWNRLWVLRDTATPASIGMLSKLNEVPLHVASGDVRQLHPEGVAE